MRLARSIDMPTNLPPEYYKVEQRYQAAQSVSEQITLLQELISTVPKHKGTDHLRADLRRKLSRLRKDAQSKKKLGRQESAYNIDREGAGQVLILGPPNAGKSSLVATLTNAAPEVAEFPYTTWDPTPGMMKFENIQIQLIDTPPLNPEHVEPAMMDLARRCDLILLMLDLQGYPLEQLEVAAALLEANRIVPTHRRSHYPEPGRLTFVPMLVLVNKCDDPAWDEECAVLQELMGSEWPMLPLSLRHGRFVGEFKQAVYDWLEIIRVYSQPPGREVNRDQPFVLPRGATVEEFAGKVHLDFVEKLKSARVWGSTAYDGLMVGRDYVLRDGDVVELRI